MYINIYIYICFGEREKERKRENGRERERESVRESGNERERERATEGERGRDTKAPAAAGHQVKLVPDHSTLCLRGGQSLELESLSWI